MTGVALRCPNCGTTKSAPGECDACHEAQVRYYCSNHKPGRWLDTPACPQCGAKFGDPVRPAAPPPPPPPTHRRPPPPPPTPRQFARVCECVCVCVCVCVCMCACVWYR